MNGPIFSGFLCERPHFLTSWYMHIFFAEAACPLGITWIDCDICVTISKKWVQKIKEQYMNRSAFWMIKYMNGSIFSKARYMNGVGFEILARSPVPKLPLLLPLPPPPPEGVTSYIWHSMDVRAERPPFSALLSIWMGHFFQQKVYDWPHFSGLVYERSHFPDVSRYTHSFRSEIFRGYIFSWYSINWLLYLSNYQQ